MRDPLVTRIEIVNRNPGHWDIYGKTGRIFAIRGGPHDYSPSFGIRIEGIYKTHADLVHLPDIPFPTDQAALVYCINWLTQEQPE
jgi:hypothetical protein